jgi:hypothetical protein
MNMYYYRFPQDSDEGRALRSFHRACQRAEQAQHDYAKKVGAVAFYEDFNSFVGGVSAVVFKDPSKVNPNIWRFVAAGPNGDRTYTPNTIVTRGTVTVQPGQRPPKNTARRVYIKPAPVSDGSPSETPTEVRFLDISPRIAIAPKADCTRAVTAERWRLQLPVVKTADFLSIVHADLSSIDGTSAKKVDVVTPVFFPYHGYYYIGLQYPVRHDLFEPIDIGQFNLTKNEMLREAHAKQ